MHLDYQMRDTKNILIWQDFSLSFEDIARSQMLCSHENNISSHSTIKALKCWLK